MDQSQHDIKPSGDHQKRQPTQLRTQHNSRSHSTHKTGRAFPVTPSAPITIHNNSLVTPMDEDTLLITGIVRGLQHNGLVLSAIDIIDDDGESEWLDGVNIRGPEGCECCHDDFDPGQYITGDRRGQVMAVWHKLILDARDPSDPDIAEPEERALCSYCANALRGELVALGLINTRRTRLEIQREMAKAIPPTDANLRRRNSLIAAIDDEIDSLAAKGVA